MVGKVLKTRATSDQKSLIKTTISFNKRKNCLKKKTFELSTLCEIDACILFVGPDGEIDTWPQEKQKLDLIIERYRSAGVSEEELKKKKNRGGGGKKQSKILNEEDEVEEEREESENKTLVPYTSDVPLSESNAVEMLDHDEFLQQIYFDPTVLDETHSSSTDLDWDWNHQRQIINGSSTEFIYDDPSISMMKFEDQMMTIEERSSVFSNTSYGYETMDDDDLILMCQMGTEHSPSLLPLW